MKAILIDVDFSSGKRPKIITNVDGKIKENLWCGGRWQNIDTGKEIRIVKDGDITPYEEQQGIEILQNEQEIKAALSENMPDRVEHSISNETIMNASIYSAEIDFSLLPQTANKDEELSFLYDAGVRGIDRITVRPQDPSTIFII